MTRRYLMAIAALVPLMSSAADPKSVELASAALMKRTADQVSADPVRGKQLFLSVGCYQCHGTRGAGGGNYGPRLAPDPLPAVAIVAFVRHPPARMPAYSEAVLSDAQIADIAAYLRSIPKGKLVADIPLLNDQARSHASGRR